MTGDRLRILGQAIKTLRKAAGMSGQRLAEAAGVSQPTVSRVESGQRVADVSSVERIVGALGLDLDTATRLNSEVADAYAEGPERRAGAGYSFATDTARRVARDAQAVAGFQSAMIPPALRTPAYASAAGDESPERLPAEARFVLTEAALRTWPGDGSAVDAQLAHLEELTERDGIRLGVLALPVAVPDVPPHGFTLYDDASVIVETFTADVLVTDPDAVAAYRTAFALVEAHAVYRAAARELVARARGELSRSPGFIQ